MGEPIVATATLEDNLSQPFERTSQRLVQNANRSATALEELSEDTRQAARADAELVEGTRRASRSLSGAIPSIEAMQGGFERLQSTTLSVSESVQDAGTGFAGLSGDIELSLGAIAELSGDTLTLARNLDRLDDTSDDAAATLRGELSRAFGLSDREAESLRRELTMLRAGMRETGSESQQSASLLERTFAAAIRSTENLLVSLRRSLNRSGREMDEFGDEARRASGDVGRLSGSLDGIATGVGASVGIFAAAGAGIFAFANQVAMSNQQLLILSERTGVATEQISQLQFAAAQNNIEFDTLEDGLVTLTERIGEAAVFGGEAGEAFQVLGINVRNADGSIRSTTEILPELADTLGRVEDRSLQVALANQIFGDESARLTSILSGGAEGLRAYAEEADRLGVTVREGAARESAEFRRELITTGQAIVAAGRNLIEDYIPSLTAILPPLRDWVLGLRDSALVNQTLIPLLNASVEALTFIANNLRLVEAAWAGVNVAFNLVVAGFATGLDFLLSGIESLLSAASSAAGALGFEGVAEATNTAAAAVLSFREGVMALGEAATETADTWAEEFEDNVREPTRAANEQLDESIEKMGELAEATEDAASAASGPLAGIRTSLETLPAAAQRVGPAIAAGLEPVRDATGEIIDRLGRTRDGFITNIPGAAARGGQRAAQGLQPVIETLMDAEGNVVSVSDNFDMLGPAAQQAGIQAAAGLQQTTGAATRGVQAAVDLNAAYFRFGVQSRQQLEQTARQNIDAFNRIRESGTSDARTLGDIWEQVAESLIRAYGRIPPEFAALNADILRNSQNTTDATTRAFENLGVSITDITDRTAADVISDFALVRVEGSRTPGVIQDAFLSGTEEIIRIQGRIPPNWETIGNQLVARGVLTSDALAAAFGEAGTSISSSLQDAAQSGADAFDRLVQEGLSAAQALAQLQFDFDVGGSALTAGNQRLVEEGIRTGQLDLSRSTEDLRAVLRELAEQLRGTTGTTGAALSAREVIQRLIDDVRRELARREGDSQDQQQQQIQPDRDREGGTGGGQGPATGVFAGPSGVSGGSRPGLVEEVAFGQGPAIFEDRTTDELIAELTMLSERLRALTAIQDPGALLANAEAINALNREMERLRDEIRRREAPAFLGATPTISTPGITVSGPGPSSRGGGAPGDGDGTRAGGGEREPALNLSTGLGLGGPERQNTSLVIGTGEESFLESIAEREARERLEREGVSGVLLRRQARIVTRDDDALNNLTRAVENNTEARREREERGSTVNVTIQNVTVQEQVPDARTMVRELGPELEEAVRRREIDLEV